MELSLIGRHALVCGSTQGIGHSAAHEIAALGASVTLLARNEAALRRVAADLPSSGEQRHGFLVADFSQPETVSRAIGQAIDGGARFEILVNNTGGPPGGRAIDAAPDAFLKGFTAHVICNQILVQAVVPQMREQRYGRIINIISTSVKAPIPNLGVSNTIRGAVASWAKTLATELGPDGITVNNVLPGFTDTARLSELFKAKAERTGRTLEAVREEALASIPAGRLADPMELGAAVAFLASPAAAYINGINLPVDGGRLPTL